MGSRMHRGPGSQMQTGPIVMRQRGQDSDAGGINTQTQKGPWPQRGQAKGQDMQNQITYMQRALTQILVT